MPPSVGVGALGVRWSISGAAWESNPPSDGLRRRTGFEDRLGHRRLCRSASSVQEALGFATMRQPMTVACVQAEPVDRPRRDVETRAATAEARWPRARSSSSSLRRSSPVYPSSVRHARSRAGRNRARRPRSRCWRANSVGSGAAVDRSGRSRAERRSARHRRQRGRSGAPRDLYNALLYFVPMARSCCTTASSCRRTTRLIWAQGDGARPRRSRPLGRIGGLICWENYMPLARSRSTSPASRSTSPRPPTTADAWHPRSSTSRASRALRRAPCHFQRASSYPDDFPLAPSSTGPT